MRRSASRYAGFKDFAFICIFFFGAAYYEERERSEHQYVSPKKMQIKTKAAEPSALQKRAAQ